MTIDLESIDLNEFKEYMAIEQENPGKLQNDFESKDDLNHDDSSKQNFLDEERKSDLEDFDDEENNMINMQMDQMENMEGGLRTSD
jgi:hypothetical protein